MRLCDGARLFVCLLLLINSGASRGHSDDDDDDVVMETHRLRHRSHRQQQQQPAGNSTSTIGRQQWINRERYLWQCWNWPKRTGKVVGVRCWNVWNFAQGLEFEADFHSKMSVCRHELGLNRWTTVHPNAQAIPTLTSKSCCCQGETVLLRHVRYISL